MQHRTNVKTILSVAVELDCTGINWMKTYPSSRSFWVLEIEHVLLPHLIEKHPDRLDGSAARLQRTARIVNAYKIEYMIVGGDIPGHYIGREQFVSNKRAIGRKRDIADLEALGEE
jgi:hypothetical protein